MTEGKSVSFFSFDSLDGSSHLRGDSGSVSFGPFDVVLTGGFFGSTSSVLAFPGSSEGSFTASFALLGSNSNSDGDRVSACSVSTDTDGSSVGSSGSNPSFECGFSLCLHGSVVLDGFVMHDYHQFLEGSGLLGSSGEPCASSFSFGSDVLSFEVGSGFSLSVFEMGNLLGDESGSSSFSLGHLFGSLKEIESTESCSGRDGSGEDSSDSEFHVEK